MQYIMKKNNVERLADTESAKQNLEKLGYIVINGKLDSDKTETADQDMTSKKEAKRSPNSKGD